MVIFKKKIKLGEQKIDVRYNGKKIVINNITYLCNSICDCYIDGDIVDTVEISSNYDYVKGEQYSLATNDDMSYLLAYYDDNEDTVDIDIYELYLVLELNNGITKQITAGRYDENQLSKYEAKIEKTADKIMDYVYNCDCE